MCPGKCLETGGCGLAVTMTRVLLSVHEGEAGHWASSMAQTAPSKVPAVALWIDTSQAPTADKEGKPRGGPKPVETGGNRRK